MKFTSQLVLALCVLPTSAFFIQSPKALTLGNLRSLNGEGVSEEYASRIQQVTSNALKNANVQQVSSSTALNASVSEMAAALEKQQKVTSGRSMGSDSFPNGARGADMSVSKNVWESVPPIILQGGSLRTWSETTGVVKRVQVHMKTEGRPLNANVELWHGPDNTPLKMSIFSEDGALRPFNAMIETPNGQNTISLRNTGQMEFPLAAIVDPDVPDVATRLSEVGTLKTIQGGAIHTYPFDHSVSSVQVLLKTSGRPLNARIELLQGPNNDKQVIDIYTEDGMERPFYMVIETPGTGNVVRIVNTASVEFPLTACVQPFMVQPASSEKDESSRGWDNGGATSSFLPWGRDSGKQKW